VSSVESVCVDCPSCAGDDAKVDEEAAAFTLAVEVSRVASAPGSTVPFSTSVIGIGVVSSHPTFVRECVGVQCAVRCVCARVGPTNEKHFSPQRTTEQPNTCLSVSSPPTNILFTVLCYYMQRKLSVVGSDGGSNTHATQPLDVVRLLGIMEELPIVLMLLFWWLVCSFSRSLSQLQVNSAT
jgi:hypothetical protein